MQSVLTLALKSSSRMSLSLGGVDILHESVEFLVESVLCLVAADKSEGICANDCDMSGGVKWEEGFHQPLAHWCWEVW